MSVIQQKNKPRLRKNCKKGLPNVHVEMYGLLHLVDCWNGSLTDIFQFFVFRIRDLKKKDEEKLLLEKATNDLESFIIDAQDKLYQEDYEKCSTEEERTEIQTNLSAASDWLYEQDETVERKVSIFSLGKPFYVILHMWKTSCRQNKFQCLTLKCSRSIKFYLKQAYEDKLKELKKLTKKLWERVSEYQERPKVRFLLSSTI